jgi:hypothetical protein
MPDKYHVSIAVLMMEQWLQRTLIGVAGRVEASKPATI